MKNFEGSKSLSDLYAHICADVPKAYNMGISFCLAGPHGRGKTTILSALLKKFCEKNYSCLYTTLTDLVNSLIDAPREDKYFVKKELTMVDFLVIDELDNRMIGSDATADLFGKNFEHIIRTRGQNKLPTMYSSNSPNPIEAFNGSLKQSIDSLMSKVKIIPVMGKDFRKVNNNE